MSFIAKVGQCVSGLFRVRLGAASGVPELRERHRRLMAAEPEVEKEVEKVTATKFGQDWAIG